MTEGSGDKEIHLADGGSVHIKTDDPEISYAVRERGGREEIVNVGTHEGLMEWLKGLKNKALGIKVQPYPPSDDSSENT